MRAAGKGIVGMKILGRESCAIARRSPQFRPRAKSPRRLHHRAESQSEQEDLIRRIAARSSFSQRAQNRNLSRGRHCFGYA